MKKYYVLLVGAMVAAAFQTHAQTKIGGSGAPDNSAMLEVTGGTGNNKGILAPRLTTTQRDAIASPATGLMIYNTSTNQLQVNTGTPAAPIWSVSSGGNAWNLTGNAGSNPNINYIGTADGQPLIFRTSATERMRMKSTGEIGIGTNNPQQILHVQGVARVTGSSGTSTAIMGRDGFGDIGNVSVGTGLNLAGGVLSATPATPGWELAGNTGSNPNINYIGTADGQPLIFRTSATERMRMKSTGEIGIGTNNPQQTLHVQGTARVTGSSGTPTAITGRDASGNVGNVTLGANLSLTGGVLSASSGSSGWGLTGNAGTNPATNYIGTTDAQPLILRTSAAERMRITSTGNVGINNATPRAPLSFASAQGPKIRFYDDGSDTETFGIGLGNATLNYHIDRNPSAVHRFMAGGSNDDGTELMRIQSNGRVGIGTNAPQQTLHVEGTARVTGSNGTPTAITGRDASGNIGNITLGANLSLTGGVLSASGGGGTTGWGLTGNAGTNPATNYIGTTDAQPLILRTSAAERMRITNTGNVGINDATPRAPLSFASEQGPKIRFYDDGSDTETYGIGLGTAALNYHIDRNPSAVHRFMAGGSNDDGTELMRIQSNGRVGIGTNAPQQTLHVEGTARVTGSNGTPTAITGRDASGNIGNITLGANLSLTGGVLSASGGGGTTGWGLTGNAGTNPATNYIGTTDAQDLALRTSAIEQMRVTAAGNVGIGTNAPTAKLDITNGDIALKQVFALRWGGETDERIYADRDLGYPGANLFMESRENMAFTIDRNNTASVSNTVGFIWSTNSSWKDGIPQELMRLTDAGNLGVGVVTPAYKLDVAGDINASASVRANGVVLTSDARLKRNISHTKYGLSTVMALNPVQYEKKNSIKDTKYDRHEIGFIAQEVAKVLPSLVTEGKDADKTLGVSYTELIPVLTKAIQEQQAQIESLKAKNQELKSSQAVTAQLVERVKQMEQMIGIKGAEGISKAVSK